ncbi:unnamed protein product [Bursaphelenchus okinawaensis]|uniref:G_PROTEIN_RECEP_F1_2 domain-containing protein n=1 Tax=Bursaphelenchus okinawaensis TaxID=465554 RepID=A0A811LEC2_9BILA|nr:unnamed protein product [Bursaphelenchus okinawaensis]CAG9121650.1 unnamed protein product [Bursaphelenchus okinawaensis]
MSSSPLSYKLFVAGLVTIICVLILSAQLMNFTINSREQCSAAVMIGQSNGLGLVMIVQIFLSIITLAQICRCIRLVRTKKLHLHANLRLLMFCGLIGYIHVSIYTSLYPIFFLMHRIKHVEPCDLVYEKLTCYILRWPLYYGVVYQSFLHLAISIERTMATRFMHTYDKGFLWWGRGIAACSFFQLGLLLATFAFYNNYLNSYNTRQKQLKKNQASQDYFVLFQSQLEEAYKKRLISSPMSRPKPKPAGRSPVFNAVLA